MDRHEHYYLLALASAGLALVTSGTFIGPVIFLAIGVLATIKGYRLERAEGGDRRE